MGNSRLKRIFWRISAAAILWLTAVAVAAPVPPKVNSDSYILMDAATGAILAERNADLRLPPASLTKIMTAYLGFRALQDGALTMTQNVRVSRRAWAQNVVGSKTFLQVDTDVSVRDLLYGIIIQSGNDASIALAEGLSGDESAFVAAMNARAEEFGMQNTRFANSTGLPDENHYSSARDMAILVRRTVLDYPENYAIYSDRQFTYNDITQDNRNTLLDAFSGADGVKTGYTKAAGYCLAASAVRDGRRLIAVVMKADSARARSEESAKLLTFGFSAFVNRQMFDGAKVRKIPVFQGNNDFVAARPAHSGVFTFPRGAEAETGYFPAQTPLIAPIAKGDIVGKIIVRINGEETQTPVFAESDVQKAGLWKSAVDYMKSEYLGHDAAIEKW